MILIFGFSEEGPVIQSNLFVSCFVYFPKLEIWKQLKRVFSEFKFVNVLNTMYKIMVHKIEDSYFEKEDFRSAFCWKIRGPFGLILAKKSYKKKKENRYVLAATQLTTYIILTLIPFLADFENSGSPSLSSKVIWILANQIV